MLRSQNGTRLWIATETGEFEPVESNAQLHSRKRGQGIPDWWVVAKDSGRRPPRKNAGGGCVSKPNFGGELQACTPDGRYTFDRGNGSGGRGGFARQAGLGRSLLADAGTILQDGTEARPAPGPTIPPSPAQDKETRLVWSQSRGALETVEGVSLGQGYSGAGWPGEKDAGRNNPSREGEKDVGPIPQGNWGIEEVDPKIFEYRYTGPVFRLIPLDDGTRERVKAMGRDPDSLLIHGNNKTDNASTGCIILDKPARERLKKRGAKFLRVEE